MGENKMKFDKPVYYLKLKMENCIRALAINGVEVESDYSGSSSEAEIPINEWIRNGENRLELLALGEDQMEHWSEGAACEVEVRVREAGQKDSSYLVTNLTFTGDFSKKDKSIYEGSMPAGSYKFVDGETRSSSDASDTVIGPVELADRYGQFGTTLRRSFVAHVPFDEWMFFSGETVYPAPISDDVSETLYDEFEPIVMDLWDLFDERDVSKILPMFEKRSREYDQAFYREPGETLEMLERSLKIVFKEGYPLNRKPWNYMQAFVSYDGRLVKIANAATGNGTVMFYDKESDSNTFYNIYWMKKDGKWIIAR